MWLLFVPRSDKVDIITHWLHDEERAVKLGKTKDSLYSSVDQCCLGIQVKCRCWRVKADSPLKFSTYSTVIIRVGSRLSLCVRFHWQDNAIMLRHRESDHLNRKVSLRVIQS